jgi:hypothetical protein
MIYGLWFRFCVLGTGFRVFGWGFRVQGLGFRVYGFGVQVLVSRVLNLEFSVHSLRLI